MSVFSWIGDLFDPISSTIDELHFSGEEKGQAQAKMAELKNKLAEIEAKVATRTLDFQSQLVEANSKIAVAEQEHGNFLSKSWRPLCSFGCFGMVTAMAFDIVPFNVYLFGFYSGFVGVYIPARSWEKKK